MTALTDEKSADVNFRTLSKKNARPKKTIKRKLIIGVMIKPFASKAIPCLTSSLTGAEYSPSATYRKIAVICVSGFRYTMGARKCGKTVAGIYAPERKVRGIATTDTAI